MLYPQEQEEYGHYATELQLFDNHCAILYFGCVLIDENYVDSLVVCFGALFFRSLVYRFSF